MALTICVWPNLSSACRRLFGKILLANPLLSYMRMHLREKQIRQPQDTSQPRVHGVPSSAAQPAICPKLGNVASTPANTSAARSGTSQHLYGASLRIAATLSGHCGRSAHPPSSQPEMLGFGTPAPRELGGTAPKQWPQMAQATAPVPGNRATEPCLRMRAETL